jgi:hypothetical protein
MTQKSQLISFGEGEFDGSEKVDEEYKVAAGNEIQKSEEERRQGGFDKDSAGSR